MRHDQANHHQLIDFSAAHAPLRYICGRARHRKLPFPETIWPKCWIALDILPYTTPEISFVIVWTLIIQLDENKTNFPGFFFKEIFNGILHCKVLTLNLVRRWTEAHFSAPLCHVRSSLPSSLQSSWLPIPLLNSQTRLMRELPPRDFPELESESSKGGCKGMENYVTENKNTILPHFALFVCASLCVSFWCQEKKA